MKKFVKLMAILLVAGLLFAGCGGAASSSSTAAPAASSGTAGASGSTAAETPTEKYKVAAIVKSQSEIWATWLAKSFMNHAEDFDDIEVTLFDAQGDPALTVQHVETAVTQGFDAICVQKASVFDSDELFRRVVEEDGIPIVAVNIPVDDGVSSNVPAPNYDLAKTMGEYAAKMLPEGARVLIFRGMVVSFEQDRYDALTDTLLNTRPDIEVLACEHADYNREKAMSMMEDWLQIYPEFDAIIALSDSMSTGAIEACKGVPGFDFSKIQVFSIDGLADGCLAIKSGTMTSTVLQNADQMAYEALKLASEILHGEVTEPTTVMVPTELITADNVDEYIAEHIKNGVLDADAVAKLEAA